MHIYIYIYICIYICIRYDICITQIFCISHDIIFNKYVWTHLDMLKVIYFVSLFMSLMAGDISYIYKHIRRIYKQRNSVYYYVYRKWKIFKYFFHEKINLNRFHQLFMKEYVIAVRITWRNEILILGGMNMLTSRRNLNQQKTSVTLLQS